MSGESTGRQQHVRGSIRFLCTHNPFYLLSACLVLYGIHVSFDGEPKLTDGWLQLQLFCGYTLLLLTIGICIARFGKVWDDARMVLLIVILLLFALASSFDGICVKYPNWGGAFLLLGFCFSLFVCETILRSLRLRFPLRYRFPFYLQLALLFGFPYFLGDMLASGRKDQLAWSVLSFPVVASTSLLTLIPAAMRGRRLDKPATEAPWNWPLYPWTLFLFVAIGFGCRTFGLGLLFDTTPGIGNAFQPYFLIPIFLAATLLLTELLQSTRSHWTAITMWMPLSFLALAFPGFGENAAQSSATQLLLCNFGSPTWLALLAIGGFYVYGFVRRLPYAEVGLLATTILGTVVAPDTIELSAVIRNMADPRFEPSLLVASWLIVSSIVRGSSVRWSLGVCLAAVVGCCWLSDIVSPQDSLLLSINACLLFLLASGIAWNDSWATIVAQLGPPMLVTLAILTNATLATGESSLNTVCYIANLVAITSLSLLFWWHRRDEVAAKCFILTIVSATAGCSVSAYYLLEHRVDLRGKSWIASGLAALAIATLVSLLKAGIWSRMNELTQRLNVWDRDGAT